MTAFVLDTSAVLTLLWQETGADRVAEVLAAGDHVISAVNLAELFTKAAEAAMPVKDLRSLIDTLQLKTHPFDAAQAFAVGQLRPATRHLGLSLGDRACLALAQQLGAVALTADRPWRDLDLGIAVECIRHNDHNDH